MITLTPSAVSEVKRLITQQTQPNAALRLGVKGGGCSGFSYFMTLDEAQPKQFDETFETEGVKVLVDTKSHLYLDGTTIDFVNNPAGMGGGFAFNNPNAKKSCGCGSSFSA